MSVCAVSSSCRPRYAPQIPRPGASPPAPAALPVRSEHRKSRMFVFGTGFVGRYVSERLKQEGWEVCGTCRSSSKKRELEEMGLDGFVFDVHKNELRSLKTLQHATHIIISIPPIVGVGDPFLRLHDELRSSLSYGSLQWLCYLSSTSVYEDCGGAWVDEDYPVNPKREPAKSRFAAEKGWLDLGRELGVAVAIFRLGGIYGPGRSALDTIIKQKSMSKGQKMRESKLYTARVHVADIYQAVNASINFPISERIYNVVDDDPAPREEVFAYARTLMERSSPDIISKFCHKDLIDIEPTKRGVDRGKRVSNARLKKELGVKLLHPTYRSGLQSILDSWKPQFEPS